MAKIRSIHLNFHGGEVVLTVEEPGRPHGVTHVLRGSDFDRFLHANPTALGALKRAADAHLDGANAPAEPGPEAFEHCDGDDEGGN